jgi:hypothetical protein
LTNNGVRTNQLGEYRIFGIEPGSYVVQANPTIADSGLSTASEERIDRILSYLKSRTSRSLVTPLDSPAVSRSVAYVPVYYPGTPDPASALILTLASGDERPGVDFAIGGVPVATVDGTVLLEDGRPAVGAVVFLRRLEIRTGLELPAPPATAADRDGRFRISNVTPGHYRIFARFRAVESPRADVLEAYSIASDARWAAASLTTSGSDVSGLRLNIAAGFTLTGQVSFDRSKLAATGSPPDPTVLGLVLRLDTGGVSVTVPVKRDGSFRISGPPAGRYKLDIKGRPISNWVPQSASVRGIDLLDIPADFAEGSTEHVIIRYTDNPAQLSGRLQTSDQRPVSDVFIIIYSSESVFWTADSRRIRAVRPASDGSFLFRDLCPGSYLLGALTDIDHGDWLQPGFLESLVASSVKVEVRTGDQLVQDLMIRKIPN